MVGLQCFFNCAVTPEEKVAAINIITKHGDRARYFYTDFHGPTICYIRLAKNAGDALRAIYGHDARYAWDRSGISDLVKSFIYRAYKHSYDLEIRAEKDGLSVSNGFDKYGPNYGYYLITWECFTDEEANKYLDLLYPYLK